MLPQPDVVGNWKNIPIVCCVSDGKHRVFWEVGGWEWPQDHPLSGGFLVERYTPNYGWNTLQDVFELPITSTVIEDLHFPLLTKPKGLIGEIVVERGSIEYYIPFQFGMKQVEPDPNLHIEAFVCCKMQKGFPCQVIIVGRASIFGNIP